MLQKDGSLSIFYTRVADQGMYKCIATNILGHDVGKVTLTVREGEISLRREWLGKEGSPHVRESQTIFNLDSGFHAMDSGFQVLDSGWFFVSGTWIPDSDRKWNSGFLELYSGFYIKIFPDSGIRIPLLTCMGQEGDREYESNQLTWLCHKLKENYRKQLKYAEGMKLKVRLYMLSSA